MTPLEINALTEWLHFHQNMTTSWYVPNIFLEGGFIIVAK